MDLQPGSLDAPFIQLAPMEGVLDWTLREMLCAQGGMDRAVTEFVRVTDQLLPKHVFLKYCPELLQNGRTLCGVPTFVQLLGGKPEWLALNAARVAEMGALGIDLNFGCPAKTVNRHDGGATLLKAPERVFQVVSSVVAAVRKVSAIPVTAKVRLGFEHKEFHRDIARAAADGGAASLVVHARTKLEGYQPPAHWQYIGWMKESVNIPVIANGEIWSADDYKRCVEVSGVRDVALGRGLVARPQLAREIKNVSKNESTDLTIIPNAKEFLIDFVTKSSELKTEAFAVARIKQILRYWCFKNSEFQNLFDLVKVEQDYDSVVGIIGRHFERYFSKYQEDSWLESKFTPGQFAPTACAPKIC